MKWHIIEVRRNLVIYLAKSKRGII